MNKTEILNSEVPNEKVICPNCHNELKNIIKEKPLIEDCAHSFLSKKSGKLTGTFGDAAIFSFGKAKFPSIAAIRKRRRKFSNW